MRNIWTIARKEFRQYFISPVAYAAAFMVLLILGIIFYANLVSAVVQQFAPTIQSILSPLTTLLLFTTPAVTMRCLSEEQRSGTLELLLTAPVRDSELVIGKWLGAFLFMMTIVAVTCLYPLILSRLISPGLDAGLVISGYLGMTLLVSTIVAVGVMASSLFSNQVATYFTTLGILLALWLLGYLAQVLGSGAAFLAYMDVSQHFYNTFYQGIIELKDVIYYLSMTVLALFLGTMAIQTRGWR